MRAFLLAPFITLLELSALPACTVNRSVPAATAVPTAPASLPAPTTDGLPVSNAPVQAVPVLTFGKTPCFGKCPHFTAQIYADGRMHYEGFKYAPVEGTYDVQLGAAVVKEMMQAAEARQFRRFNAEYTSGASDMPSTGLTITYPDGSKKSVRAEGNAPAELQQLFALINTRIEKALSTVNAK
ncbi:DUF6438 domain-containing protein [Hymenobacter sp. UYP22]|uniref:DUF6438 domain-containing protein n=1 Tax=Hymenobacter sp. UYP22 TaxID=3156348 RepID=UPI003398C1E6